MSPLRSLLLLTAFVGHTVFVMAQDPLTVVDPTAQSQRSANAAKTIVEKLILRQSPPSLILDRLNTVSGFPEGGLRRFELEADDARRTLIVRVPPSYGPPQERERLLEIVRTTVRRMDAENPMVSVDLYMVETSLLTDEEFILLDETLRKGPINIEGGATRKGVVFRKQMLLPNQEIYEIGESQREATATTRPEPVEVSGTILPSIRAEDRVFISADLVVEAEERPIAKGMGRIGVGGQAISTGKDPIILFVGAQKASAQAKDRPSVQRHEAIIYLWVKPQPQAAP